MPIRRPAGSPPAASSERRRTRTTSARLSAARRLAAAGAHDELADDQPDDEQEHCGLDVVAGVDRERVVGAGEEEVERARTTTSAATAPPTRPPRTAATTTTSTRTSDTFEVRISSRSGTSAAETTTGPASATAHARGEIAVAGRCGRGFGSSVTIRLYARPSGRWNGLDAFLARAAAGS